MINDNNEIKRICRTFGINQYELGDRMGITPARMSLILRYPLKEEMAQRVNNALDELISERQKMVKSFLK